MVHIHKAFWSLGAVMIVMAPDHVVRIIGTIWWDKLLSSKAKYQG